MSTAIQIQVFSQDNKDIELNNKDIELNISNDQKQQQQQCNLPPAPGPPSISQVSSNYESSNIPPSDLPSISDDNNHKQQESKNQINNMYQRSRLNKYWIRFLNFMIKNKKNILIILVFLWVFFLQIQVSIINQKINDQDQKLNDQQKNINILISTLSDQIINQTELNMTLNYQQSIINKFNSTLYDQIINYTGLNTTLNEQKNIINKINSTLFDQIINYSGLNMTLNQQQNIINKLNSTQYDLIINQTGLNTTLNDQQNIINKLNSTLYDQIITQTVFNTTLNDLLNTINKLNSTLSDQMINQTSFNTTLIDLSTKQESHTQRFTTQEQINYNLNQTIFDRIADSQENLKSLDSKITDIVQNLPQTKYYGPFIGNWVQTFIPNQDQMISYPKTVEITLKRKSKLTFIANFQSYITKYDIFFTFLKNRKPVGVRSMPNQNMFHYASWKGTNSGWGQVNLVQEDVIEKGYYEFEVGIMAYAMIAKELIYIKGMGFSITVQEL